MIVTNYLLLKEMFQLLFLALAFFLVFTSPLIVTNSNHKIFGIVLVSLQQMIH